MNQHKLISSKALIAELYSDFNITMDEWVNKANRYIERALELMEIDGYYELSSYTTDVVDYQASLPCDEKKIIGVLCGDKGSFFRLPLTRDLRLGQAFQTLNVHESSRGAINGSYLKTNFRTGKVTYAYYRVPIDADGGLLIPDNAKVLEALPFFIIYKLSLSGYVHPVISFSYAEAKWKELYPQAKNSMNYPSLEDMARYVEISTNPLFNHMLEMEGNGTQDIQSATNFATNINIFE